jgi:ribonuclease HI
VIKVYADGGCLNNGTPQAEMYGSYVVFMDDGSEFSRESFFITREFATQVASVSVLMPATNNVAEYCAMLLAMRKVWTLTGGQKDAEFMMDSNLVVNQANGLWRVSKDGLHLLPFISQIKNMLATCSSQPFYGKWTLTKAKRSDIVALLGH